MFSPSDAIAAGFLDKIVAADELMAAAKTEANRLAGLNLTAYRGTKLKVRGGLLKILDDAIALDYQEQIALLG
jgi:enoyl-CoA hydratase